MVEKTKDQEISKEDKEFCISASDLTDITLTEEESERLIKMIKKGPNDKAKQFTKDAIKFYEEMLQKSDKFNNNF